MEIFKAYDVRGIYGEALTEDVSYRIGKAFVDLLGCNNLVVGHDMRLSSMPLVEAFIRGATEQGSDVVNIGLCSTDCLYFASGKMDLPGVMFTASHNPAKYNGIKFCKKGAAPINYDNGLKDIKSIVMNGKFKKNNVAGDVTHINVLSDFASHVRSFIDVLKVSGLKIAVDAGNGMAGKIVPEIFSGIDVSIVPLYFELDGNFPNHEANPIKPENIVELQQKVKSEGCDFGLAFDGDADRIFFVDENGESVDSSFISSLIIDNILSKNKDEKVIYNLVCSNIVKETIEKNHAEAIQERVGHSYIKETMKKTGAIFACEHSAHYYYRDNFRADSGIITAMIVCEVVSASGKKLSELLQAYKKYHKIQETNSEVSDKGEKMKELKEIYDKKSPSDFTDVDGITFRFSDWWFNVRPSNTEPVLRLNLEADTKELMEEKRDEVLKVIRG